MIVFVFYLLINIPLFIGDKLKSLLQFFCGEDHVPSTIKPILTFHDSGIFPTASTCSMELSIPASHKTYISFASAMDKALEWHGGFGCA